MARVSLREKILESGVRTVHESGFANAGVREITAAAGVPQGSFTNHFRSKEDFGLAVLDRYFEGVESLAALTLGNGAAPAVDRLYAYFAIVTDGLAGAQWRNGCLLGNMSLEAAEHSVAIRERLVEVFGRITDRFAITIREAQVAGEMRVDFSAEEIATVLMSSWQGAMLWMKVQRSPEAIELFKQVTLASFLTRPATSIRTEVL